MHDRLRELWRSREERAPEPTAAVVLDAQSTRSSPQGGPSGYDAGKQVGRDRYETSVMVCHQRPPFRRCGRLARAAIRYAFL